MLDFLYMSKIIDSAKGELLAKGVLNMDNMDNEQIFSETDDTKLKRFLTGNRIYTMLAAAIISLIVFIPTFASIMGIYHNINESENVIELSDIDLSADLDGQYVTGNAYKFLTRIGYIAASEAAATDYYYIMYIDAPTGEQVATLVQADKRGDEDLQNIIDAYLSYAQDPEAGYFGNVLELTGRFKNMSSAETQLFSEGLSQCGITGPALGYTLKLTPMPVASDTVPYWFIAVPFGIAAVVCGILFVYGLILEDKRAKANLSPYPYQNRKKKRK